MEIKLDLKPIGEAIGGEINTVVSTLRDKGGKRFSRAFFAAGFMVFAAYVGVYRPPQMKMVRLERDIRNAKAKAEYSAKFGELREQLGAAYKRLPDMKDREQWLTNSVRDSLTVAGLVTEDLKPVRETEQEGLIYQTASVTLSMKFAEFYDWIMRLEGAQPMLHLQTLEFAKKTQQRGVNGAACEIATVIPKRRFR